MGMIIKYYYKQLSQYQKGIFVGIFITIVLLVIITILYRNILRKERILVPTLVLKVSIKTNDKVQKENLNIGVIPKPYLPKGAIDPKNFDLIIAKIKLILISERSAGTLTGFIVK